MENLPKPTKQAFDDQLKVHMTDMVKKDMQARKDAREIRSTRYKEIFELAKTKEFEMPKKEVKARDPKWYFDKTLWHKRLNYPFIEDMIPDFYVYKEKKADDALFYGLTKFEKNIWEDFKLMVFTKRRGRSDVYSDIGITKVIKVDFEYFKTLRYPSFRVERRDKKKYEFTECDYNNMNQRDLIWLLEYFRNINRKNPKIRYAEYTIRRYMEGQIKKAYCTDFQMALEAGETKINILPPLRDLNLNHHQIWEIVELRDKSKGIVYISPYWDGNLMMLFEEVHKYSTGTLTLVLQEIETILDNAHKAKEKPLGWDFKRRDYEEAKAQILERLEFRRIIQRFEMMLNIRANRYSTEELMKQEKYYKLQQELEETAKQYEKKDQAGSSEVPPVQEQPPET